MHPSEKHDNADVMFYNLKISSDKSCSLDLCPSRWDSFLQWLNSFLNKEMKEGELPCLFERDGYFSPRVGLSDSPIRRRTLAPAARPAAENIVLGT